MVEGSEPAGLLAEERILAPRRTLVVLLDRAHEIARRQRQLRTAFGQRLAGPYRGGVGGLAFSAGARTMGHGH